MESNFIKNYKIDYKRSGQTTRKGNYDYLSWAHAQKIMREEYPKMNWKTVWNEANNSLNWSGFVKLIFENDGETWEIFYPILNHQNKPIPIPNQFDLNNAQMRGFAKGFAMITGHSLSLFTGEDLEQYETVKDIAAGQTVAEQLKKQIKDHAEFQALTPAQKKVVLAKNETAELKNVLDRMNKKTGDNNGK